MSILEFKKSFQDHLFYNPSTGYEFEYARLFSRLHYTIFKFRKKSGGTRVVEAPLIDLKKVQKELLPIIRNTLVVHHRAFGSRREKSFIDNALEHEGQKSIFVLDIKNFYKNCTVAHIPSVYEIESRRCLMKALVYCFYWDEKAEGINDGYLSTGNPLSPIIANALFFNADVDLQILADECGAIYTRYLDDVTFSFKQEVTDEEFKTTFANKVINTIVTQGWEPHPEKTKWLSKENDAIVITGVDVRDKPKVTRKYIKNVIRPALNNLAYQLIMYPTDVIKYVDAKGAKDFLYYCHWSEWGQKEIHGLLQYIKDVSPEQHESLMDYFKSRIRKFALQFPDHANRDHRNFADVTITEIREAQMACMFLTHQFELEGYIPVIAERVAKFTIWNHLDSHFGQNWHPVED